jgi:hypothetical protein
MASVTVRGVYRDGRVELSERPEGVAEPAHVLVTFLTKEDLLGLANPPRDQAARRQAVKRLLARLREGLPLGGPPYLKREELYDRVQRLCDRLDEERSRRE